MRYLLIWSYLVFILLLHYCSAPKTPKNKEIMYTPSGESSATYWRRMGLLPVYHSDPCGQSGMWLYYSPEAQQQANRLCQEAFNVFVGLGIEEQENSCRNAASPECRGLEPCEHLIYGCTFICDDEAGPWHYNAESKKFEREWTQKTKHFKLIVEDLYRHLGQPRVPAMV